MRKIKMRYVAQVIIEDWIRADDPGVMPLEKIKEQTPMVAGAVADIIREGLSGNGTVEINEQYNDVYEVEET